MWVVAKLQADFKPEDAEGVVRALAEMLDVRLPSAGLAGIVAQAESLGGPGAFKDKNSAANLLAKVSRSLFSAPEAQLC
jgi:hypothetical protein